MKKILSAYKLGAGYLLSDDDLVSFYVFFALCFSACAWLFSACELATAIPLSIVMIGYVVDVVLFSWLKGNAEGTRLEKVFGICYVVVFAILFISGCTISFREHIIIMSIILVMTLAAVAFREYIVVQFLQAIMLLLPFLVLVFSIAYTSLPIVLKFIIPLVYTMCAPFIAYYEDSSAAQNIFELAYEYTWSPKYEKTMRELDSKDIVV